MNVYEYTLTDVFGNSDYRTRYIVAENMTEAIEYIETKLYLDNKVHDIVLQGKTDIVGKETVEKEETIENEEYISSP